MTSSINIQYMDMALYTSEKKDREREKKEREVTERGG